VSMMIEMVSTVIVKCRFVISDEKYMFWVKQNRKNWILKGWWCWRWEHREMLEHLQLTCVFSFASVKMFGMLSNIRNMIVEFRCLIWIGSKRLNVATLQFNFHWTVHVSFFQYLLVDTCHCDHHIIGWCKTIKTMSSMQEWSIGMCEDVERSIAAGVSVQTATHTPSLDILKICSLFVFILL
jgi:hypothetical protein